MFSTVSLLFLLSRRRVYDITNMDHEAIVLNPATLHLHSSFQQHIFIFFYRPFLAKIGKAGVAPGSPFFRRKQALLKKKSVSSNLLRMSVQPLQEWVLGVGGGEGGGGRRGARGPRVGGRGGGHVTEEGVKVGGSRRWLGRWSGDRGGGGGGGLCRD